MNTSIAIPIAAAMLAVVFALIAYFLLRAQVRRERSEIRLEADRVLADANKAADSRLREAAIEAKEKVLAAQVEFDKGIQLRRQEVASLEKRVTQKEENLDRKLGQQEKREEEFARKERALADAQKAVERAYADAQKVVEEQQKRLEQISGLTAADAKRDLIRSIENDARVEAAGLMRRIEEEAIEQATQKARHQIGMAIQRLASDTVIEATVSVVELPSDDLKGRIIGREGRNIRALEAATGVDLIIDDTPEAIVISAFEPIRREVARLALDKLIADGRIHPARIEEIVEKVRPELIKLLGRLKYRTSYGQNVLQHSREVAWLAANMAGELGARSEIAKRAGLLHDIGKAIDREMEGTHLELGREVLKKFGESDEVIHAMECHHGDYEPRSLEAVLVNGADALSAARPGARREILETYVKRLEKLEHIADGFKGVQKAFAIQAGRELRIIVEANRVTDDEALWLSRDIARKIESELQYPGQIKITVIRETRSVEYAR
jgi:ribonuclease Y